MTYDPQHLPDDPTELKRILVAFIESDAARQKAFDEMVAEMSRLNVTVQKLTEMLFGKKSEKLPKDKPKSSRIFKRSGLVFSQSSMCRWMRQIADLLEPLYDRICEEVLLSFCMQIDATFVKCRDENLQGKCRQTYVYGARGDDEHPFDAFYFSRDGTSQSLMKFVLDFENNLQCDDNSVTNPIFLPKNPVPGRAAPTKQGCWSHGRRYFVKAGQAVAEVVFVLEMIGELYEVEDRARKLDAAGRLALRQKESLGILDRIFAWCRENQRKYLPKEAMRTAIDYLLRNETALRVYCTDGRLEIDNNACERMLRQWAVGRKNWLFFGNERGGKTASILVTLLSSARRHGLNEFEYLCDILSRLADLPSESEYREMLPDRWQPKTA